MAILAVNLREYPFLLAELEKEVGKLPSDSHITILYLGEDATNIIPYVIEATSFACSKLDGVLDATVSSVGHFSSKSDKPVILPVDSVGLHTFRSLITSYLDGRGVSYPKTWATFSPHITLRYSAETPKRQSITPQTFFISSFELWPENDGEANKIVFSIGSNAPSYAKLSESIHTVNKGITYMDESSKKLEALTAKLKLQKALTANIVSGWAKRAQLEEMAAAATVPGTEYGYTIKHSGSLEGEFVQDPTQEPNKPHSSFRPVESTPPVVSIQKSLEATSNCRACGYVYKAIHNQCPRCDRTQESKDIWNR